MAEIVIFSGETRRIAEFLDEQLDPNANPIVSLVAERLPRDRWVVLHDLLYRKLAFFCMASLAWRATVDIAERLRVTDVPEAYGVEVPAEVHELVWSDIPADIMATFDNSEAYRDFNHRWGESIREWAGDRGWDPLQLPFRAFEETEELRDLERWLDERGYGDAHRPVQNVLVEVVTELARRARSFVVEGRSDDHDLDGLLSAT